MKVQMIVQGDYVEKRQSSRDEWGFVTMIAFIGEEGECECEVIRENELPFKARWYPISVHGYHQACKVPDGIDLCIKNPTRMWNGRFVENGAMFLVPTKEKRDTILRGEG